MRSNILGGEGYFTNEERKLKFKNRHGYLTFESCYDLSDGVIITADVDSITLAHYTQDVACFIAWWSSCVLCSLNGFSGMDTIHYDIAFVEII